MTAVHTDDHRQNRKLARTEGASDAELAQLKQDRALGVISSDAFWVNILAALPAQLKGDDWFRSVATAALLAEPKLLRADKVSLTIALMHAAKLGLMPGVGYGEIALFVDGNGQVQHRTMYGGQLKLVRQSGLVPDIDAQAVYANDPCELRVGKMPKHTIPLGERGEIIGCYAYARLQGSEHVMVEYMTWDAIWTHAQRYSDALKGSRQTPWKDETAKGEMGCKTVLNRLMKMLPKTPLIAAAFADEAEMGRAERARDVTPEPKAETVFTPQITASPARRIISHEEWEAGKPVTQPPDAPKAPLRGLGRALHDVDEDAEPETPIKVWVVLDVGGKLSATKTDPEGVVASLKMLVSYAANSDDKAAVAKLRAANGAMMADLASQHPEHAEALDALWPPVEKETNDG